MVRSIVMMEELSFPPLVVHSKYRQNKFGFACWAGIQFDQLSKCCGARFDGIVELGADWNPSRCHASPSGRF